MCMFLYSTLFTVACCDMRLWTRASTSILEASMAKPGAGSKKCLMFDSITDFDSGGGAAENDVMIAHCFMLIPSCCWQKQSRARVYVCANCSYGSPNGLERFGFGKTAPHPAAAVSQQPSFLMRYEQNFMGPNLYAPRWLLWSSCPKKDG